MATDEVLRISDLSISFNVYGGLTKVLRGVNLHLDRGERVAIVGETGCGKTTSMKAILGILPRQARVERGDVVLGGVDVLNASADELRGIRRRRAAMIFQDPTASLNPIFTIGEQVADIIGVATRQGGFTSREERKESRDVAIRALTDASMPDPERVLKSYPLQLSGGMRQRVCIAMALATPRDLLIADEPTTNLDVTIQDQVLRLIKRLAVEKGTALILITHSLGVARETSDRIHVMYAGTMIEVGPTSDLFETPMHPIYQGPVELGAEAYRRGYQCGHPWTSARLPEPARGLSFRAALRSRDACLRNEGAADGRGISPPPCFLFLVQRAGGGR
jgi:peptide/nickel transport system ATP-binding protein